MYKKADVVRQTAQLDRQTISQKDRQTDRQTDRKKVSGTESLILHVKYQINTHTEMDRGRPADRLSLKVMGQQTEISRKRSFTYPTPLTTS